MLDQVIGLLTGRRPADVAGPNGELRVCIAALLVEAARMDDRFSATERSTIERLLAERFALSPTETASLLRSAEEAVAHSAQLLGFTEGVVREVAIEDRVRIVEMLWEVAYADGVLSPEEDALLRRVAGLIHVPDRERGLARQQVMARLGFA
jgi:uncharacterized tellurite resistance protein B-like protein